MKTFYRLLSWNLFSNFFSIDACKTNTTSATTSQSNFALHIIAITVLRSLFNDDYVTCLQSDGMSVHVTHVMILNIFQSRAGRSLNILIYIDIFLNEI